MNNISQEQLSAYLDNELAAEQRQQVEQALASDANLRQRLQQLRIADEAARQWFSDIDSQPLPAGLENLIREAPLQDNVIPLQDNVIPLQDNVIPLQRRMSRSVWGIAASLLMASGLLWQMQSSDPVDARLQQFADTALTGEILDAGDWKAELMMSWYQADGSGCREVVRHTPQQSTVMTACGQPGQWQWQWQTEQTSDQYQTASGPDSRARQPMSAETERHWLSQQP